MKKIIENIKQLKLPIDNNFSDFKNSNELFYNIQISLFENNKLNHLKRLDALKKIKSIMHHKRNIFSIAHNLSLSAKVEQELGNIKSAIQKSTDSYKLFNTMHETNDLAINGSIFAYSNLANIYSKLNLNNISLDYLSKAQKALVLSNNNYIPKIRIYLNLGICYHALGKYQKSLKYLKEIYTLALKKNDYHSLIPIIVNMSSIYFSMNDYEESFRLNKQSLKFLKNIDDVNYKPAILKDLAIYYKKNNMLENALKLFKESLDINLKILAHNNIPNEYNNIADTFLELNKISEAIENYKLAIKNSQNEEHLKSKNYALGQLCRLLDKNNKNFIQYYKMYVDSL